MFNRSLMLLVGLSLISTVEALPASLRMSCIPIELDNFNSYLDVVTAPWAIKVYEDPENSGKYKYRTTFDGKITNIRLNKKNVPSKIEGHTDKKNWKMDKLDDLKKAERINRVWYSSLWRIDGTISYTFPINWATYTADTTKSLDVSGMYKCTGWHENKNNEDSGEDTQVIEDDSGEDTV